MNLILHTILQEKQRIEYMLSKYQDMLTLLPKGSISERKVNGKSYFYLKFRDGKKVVSQYSSKEDISHVRKQIEKRRHIAQMLKSLQHEKRIANKVLEDMI